MKLNKKGLQRLQMGCERLIENGLIMHRPIGYEQIDALRNYNFESHDFDDGVVVFSLKEAKAVLECVEVCAHSVPSSVDVSEVAILCDKLKAKINQVEGE